TDEQYQLYPEAIEAAITPWTRAVVTISPNNPTGAVYSESTLREVNELCRLHGVYHIHDEAYEYFVFRGRHFSPASIEGSEAHTISLFSLSKSYGFASWRIGYMVIPEHLLTAVKKIQDTVLICAPVISQFAAVGAMHAGRGYCEEKLAETRAVRQIMETGLSEIEDFCTVPGADGAFYYLLRLDTRLMDMEVVTRLIERHGVGVMPGSTFGVGSGCCLRVSYGPLRRDTAGEAVDRLVTGLRSIVKG